MRTKSLTQIALMTALLCILAPISLPLPASPIAFTLATFALYLTAYLLPPAQGLAVVGLYLLIGAAGLPVFSGYGGGISRFAAPGGGYLVGYFLLVGVGSFSLRRFPTKTLRIGGLLCATLLMYLLGTLWMAFVTNSPFLALLPTSLCFLPFDGLKLWLASRIGRAVQRHLKNQRP